MFNRRKNERLNCYVPVEGKQGDIFDQTATFDFSKGGLGFISPKEIPLHKEVTVGLELTAAGEPVFVKAKVQWIRPLGFHKFRGGLSFESFLSKAKSRLNQYFFKK